MATEDNTGIPVSTDPDVPLAESTNPADATNKDGTVDTDKAARAGAAKRQQRESAKQDTAKDGVVPTGGVVRQLEDGTETDRRTGANADKSLAGENLPVLRPNEPDPRQGVTTGDLTNPGIPDGDKSVEVTFKRGYHLFNAGEKANFSQEEVDRLRLLGVAD